MMDPVCGMTVTPETPPRLGARGNDVLLLLARMHGAVQGDPEGFLDGSTSIRCEGSSGGDPAEGECTATR